MSLFVQAYYDIVNTRTEEVTGYRTYSPSNSYIYITSSTEFPKVNIDEERLISFMILKMAGENIEHIEASIFAKHQFEWNVIFRLTNIWSSQ